MKKIHFIAIGGSVMHQLALDLQHQGYEVSGSDDEIYEPSRTLLAQATLLPAEMGWFPERITADLDAVILGMHAKADNPELLRAQALQLKVYAYPEFIYEQSVHKTRVVIAGSHGKTTLTAMIMHVLRCCGKQFDYLVGARLEGFEASVQLSHAPLMILEGDEYFASPIHRLPKIRYYQPHITLLSGIAWDHINVFPTFENYLQQFADYLQHLPPHAHIVYSGEDEHLPALIRQFAPSAASCYAYKTPHYRIEDGSLILQTEIGEVPLKVMGKHNALNVEGARKVCAWIGIENADFYAAMRTFKGAAKRLETLFSGAHCAVFRDFAHAPSKVKATTAAVREMFPQRRLVAVFELHTYSSLNAGFLQEYRHSLADCDIALIYIDEQTFVIKKLPPLSHETIAAAFEHPHLHIAGSRAALEAALQAIEWKNTNLLLMSSGHFGGLDLQKTVAANFL